MDKSIDSKLIDIKNAKWLPWIGDNYFSIPTDQRLLIIGESHYHDNTDESISKHNSAAFTRRVIEEMAIGRDYYQTKIFPNLHRALFRNDQFDSQKFWNLVSFYNFVQRPMSTNKARPTTEDFINGWITFFELIKFLKPKTCLFLGSGSVYTIHDAIKTTDLTVNGVHWEDRISNTPAKSALISGEDNFKTNLYFIRHTSQMFSWSKWNDYLMRVIPNHLIWFEEQLSDK